MSRTEKVCLRPEPREAERLFRHVCETRESGPPQLILNDHCQICEFRERCRAQAVQEDNLSLLRGLGEKEVKATTGRGFLPSLNSPTRSVHGKGKKVSAEIEYAFPRLASTGES